MYCGENDESLLLYQRHLFISDVKLVHGCCLTGPAFKMVKPGAKGH